MATKQPSNEGTQKQADVEISSPARNSVSKKITYNLDDVISILKKAGSKHLRSTKKVSPAFLDTFLYSGRFNSVLGLRGFRIFKDKLREVIKRVNNDDFGANYINLDSMFEVLLASGVYYLDDFLPNKLEHLKKNDRWLTTYRYISKNLDELCYWDFREIVKRFQNTGGHSFFIAPNDSESLRALGRSTLFSEIFDIRAALLQISQKELRAICKKVGISPARSIEETTDRIIEFSGESALAYLPTEHKTRKYFFIKDWELATGQDIIQLESYLIYMAIVVRDDLTQFINKQRQGVLVQENDIWTQ